MFLKRHRWHKDRATYEYWSLVKTVRTARGPRHQTVADLGKLDGAQVGDRGWEELEALLEGRPSPRQMELGQLPPRPLWRKVNVREVRVERVRQFGRVYLGLALWRRLKLHEVLKGLVAEGREEIGWEVVACVLTLGKFCAQPSELSVAERWYDDTALEDLLGVALEKINETRLYRGLDQLLPHKDALCRHLLERYRDWFGVEFNFLVYDVSSTFVEGEALKNKKAAYGYSRDSRPDCKQVCIGLVVTPEGLPLSYEVFAGNRADVTTLKEIVTAMEEKYGQPHAVWVIDRGIASDANLQWLRERQALYLVGTPKSRIRHYQAALNQSGGWKQVRKGLEVKFVPAMEAGERVILCRSTDRAAKEGAMLERQRRRFLAGLHRIATRLCRHPSEMGKAERRVGRWLGKYPRAAKFIAARMHTDAEGRACALEIVEDLPALSLARSAHGAYLLRTNHPSSDPVELWRWYIQLTQAEAAFRTEKTDLLLRPLFHQKTHRVEAHILVCFLSLVLWRSLEQWMKAKGLGDCARQLLIELDQLHSMDVVLPTAEIGPLRLRVVARPEKPLAELLAHLELELPGAPKILANVVPKNGIQESQVVDNSNPRF